jgi:hypothetical protein
MAGASSVFSPRSRLTRLQQELLLGFFAHPGPFFLTGGAALVGFHFGHRTTEDLDFFALPGADLEDGARLLATVASALGASVTPVQTYPDFRRVDVVRGVERCIVDLVVDRAPPLDTTKDQRGAIRLDTLREIAANKVSTLIGRSQIKDLLDLKLLLESGISLDAAVSDAERKDASANPAGLAWVLDQTVIRPDARLPYGADPLELDRFRRELVERLQRLAWEKARK